MNHVSAASAMGTDSHYLAFRGQFVAFPALSTGALEKPLLLFYEGLSHLPARSPSAATGR
jgi:hypothetical protein